jgi:8-oxo-dGTP diphosphatase
VGFQHRGGDDRAVAVYTAGIVEALGRAWNAGRLVDEVSGASGDTPHAKGGIMSAETNKRYRFATALVEQGDRYLITQRCAPEALLGLWEFPGSKVEPGDSDEAVLERALRERLGIAVEIGRLKACRTQPYVGYSVEVALYEARMTPGETLRPLAVADFRWVTAGELEQYPFLPADQTTTDLLLGLPRESPKRSQSPRGDSTTAPRSASLRPGKETS